MPFRSPFTGPDGTAAPACSKTWVTERKWKQNLRQINDPNRLHHDASRTLARGRNGRRFALPTDRRGGLKLAAGIRVDLCAYLTPE